MNSQQWLPRSLVLKPHRLNFRTWCDDDLPLARALFGNPLVTALVGGPFDDERVRARLATEISTQREHGYQYWPMFADGAFVGCCGLKPRDSANRAFELGFYLRPEHWGRGYAVEAGHSVIAFAWRTLGASSLFAGHHPENAGSKKTLLALGFVFTHTEHYAPTGLMHPSYVLARPKEISQHDKQS